jgi:hypothetical protein
MSGPHSGREHPGTAAADTLASEPHDLSARQPLPPIDDLDHPFPPPSVEGPSLEEFTDLLPELPPEPSVVKRVIFVVIGVTALLLGTILWVTPIVGGAPLFWIPGLILLAKASDPFRRLVNHGDRRLPRKLRQLLRWARDKTSRKGHAEPAGAKPEPTTESAGDPSRAQSPGSGETVPTPPAPRSAESRSGPSE